jgi:hypothetical protein
MKPNILKIVLFLFITASIASCEDQGYAKYNPETTPSASMTGEWYIDITDQATGEVYVEHAIHKTYDSNDGKMYITDRILGSTPPKFTGWWLETKLDVNTKDLTFSATDALNTADESIVKITEGKIIKNAAKSKDGHVVDSIYFKAVFDYEPTQVLIYSGHRRTGFLEDEY